MYCLELQIQPAAALTFRILPGSILNIATYPFVPPTTLSGFLRRLAMLSAGLEIPETKVDKENPPIYILPPRYIALGAYPALNTYSGVHRTYRKGMREFSHDIFSRLYIEEDRANFQLHTWEYLIATELTGYVASESATELEIFQEFKGYGCKLGKEGYGILTEVSPQPILLERQVIAAHPSTILPMEALLLNNPVVPGCDIYNLYRYQWSNSAVNSMNEQELTSNRPTSVEGFVPFVAAYFPRSQNSVPTLDYYSQGEINIPVSLINLLKGETYV